VGLGVSIEMLLPTYTSKVVANQHQGYGED